VYEITIITYADQYHNRSHYPINIPISVNPQYWSAKNCINKTRGCTMPYNKIKEYALKIKTAYKGKNAGFAYSYINNYLMNVLKVLTLSTATIVTTIVLFVRFDTKYSMFTAEYMNTISSVALDLSLWFFFFISIMIMLKIAEIIYDSLERLRKDMFYEW